MKNAMLTTPPPPPVEERGNSSPSASCASSGAAAVAHLCIHHYHHHHLDKEISASCHVYGSAGAEAGCLFSSSFHGTAPGAAGEDGDAASSAVHLTVDLWGRILPFLPTREVLECGKVCHRARMASFALISSATTSSPSLAIHPSTSTSAGAAAQMYRTTRGLDHGRLHTTSRRRKASIARSTVPPTRAGHPPRSSSGTIRHPSEANCRVKNLEGTAASDSAVVPLTHAALDHKKRKNTNHKRFAGVGEGRATATATAARSLPSSSFTTKKSFASPMVHGGRRPSGAAEARGTTPTRTTTATTTTATATTRSTTTPLFGNGRQYLTERWERVNHVELCPPGEVLLTGYIPAPLRKLVVLAISAVDGMTDELECAVYMRRVTAAPMPGQTTQGAKTTAAALSRAKAMATANFCPPCCWVCGMMRGSGARRRHGAGSDTTTCAGCANSGIACPVSGGHACGGGGGGHSSSDPVSSFPMRTKKATPCSIPFAPPWAVVDDKEERDLDVVKEEEGEEEEWFVRDAATGLPFTTRVDVPLVFADPASHIQFQGERFLTCTSRHGDWFVFDAVLEALVELPITIQFFAASPNGRRFLVEDQANFYYCDTEEQLQVQSTPPHSSDSTGLDATLRPHRHPQPHRQDDEDVWSHTDDEAEEVALYRSEAPEVYLSRFHHSSPPQPSSRLTMSSYASMSPFTSSRRRDGMRDRGHHDQEEALPQEEGTCSPSSSRSSSYASASLTATRRRGSRSDACGASSASAASGTATALPPCRDHGEDANAEREGMLMRSPACDDGRDRRTSTSSYSYSYSFYSCSYSSCSYSSCSYSSCSYLSLRYFDPSGCSRRRRVRRRDGVLARMDGASSSLDNGPTNHSHRGQTSCRSHVLFMPPLHHEPPRHHPHHHHHHHDQRDRRFRDHGNRIQRWMDNLMEETHGRWQARGVNTGDTSSTAGESRRSDGVSQDPAAAAAGGGNSLSSTTTSIRTAVTVGNWWRRMPAPAHYHLMEEPSNGVRGRTFAVRREERGHKQQQRHQQQQRQHAQHRAASSILTASLWSLSRSDHDHHGPNTNHNNSMDGVHDRRLSHHRSRRTSAVRPQHQETHRRATATVSTALNHHQQQHHDDDHHHDWRRQRRGLQCSPGRVVEEDEREQEEQSECVGSNEDGSWSSSSSRTAAAAAAAFVVGTEEPHNEEDNDVTDGHDDDGGYEDYEDYGEDDYEYPEELSAEEDGDDGDDGDEVDEDSMMEDVWQDCFGDTATRRPGGGDRSAATFPARRVHLSVESSSTPPLLVGSLKHSSAAWHHFWVGEHSILYEHEEGREVFCQDFRIPDRDSSRPAPHTMTSPVRIGQVTDEQSGEAVPHLQCRRDCAFVQRRLHWNPLTARPLATTIPTSSKTAASTTSTTAMAEASLIPTSVSGASPSANGDGGEDDNAAHRCKMTVLRSLFTATAHCLMGLSLDRMDATSPPFYYSQAAAVAFPSSTTAGNASGELGRRSGLHLDSSSSSFSFYLSHSTVSVVAHAGAGRRHDNTDAGGKDTNDKNPQRPYRRPDELVEMGQKEDSMNNLHGIAGAGRGRRQPCGGGWCGHINDMARRLPQGDACACDEYLFLDCQRSLLHVVQVVPPQQHQQQHDQQPWRTLVGGPSGPDATPAIRRRVVPPAKTATTPLEVRCCTHALPAHLSSNLADCRPENLLVVVPEGLHLSFKDMVDQHQPPPPHHPHHHNRNPEDHNHHEEHTEENQNNVDQDRQDGKKSGATENHESLSGYPHHSRFTAGRGVWLLQMQERRRSTQFWYGGSSSATAWLPYEEGSQAGNHQRRYVMLSSDLSVCRELALGDYCDDFDGAPIVLSDRGALLFTEASSSQGTIGASLLFNGGDGDGGAVEFPRSAEGHPLLPHHHGTRSNRHHGSSHHHRTGNAGGMFGSWDPFFSGMEAGDMGATTTTTHNNSHGGLGASLACSVLNALGLSQAVTSGYGCLVTFPYVGVMEDVEAEVNNNNNNNNNNDNEEEGKEGVVTPEAARWCRGTRTQTNEPPISMEREGHPEEQGKPMACQWRTPPPYSVDCRVMRGACACACGTTAEDTTGAEPRPLRPPACQCCCCCCHPMPGPSPIAPPPHPHRGVGGLVVRAVDWILGWLAARRPSPYTMATFLSFISCYTVAASLVWTISVLLSFVWWELGGGAAGGNNAVPWFQMSSGSHATAVLGGEAAYTEEAKLSCTSSSAALGALDAWWFALTVLFSALYITHYVR